MAMRYPTLDAAIDAILKIQGRWPAGAPGSKGGQFAPKGVSGAGGTKAKPTSTSKFPGEDAGPIPSFLKTPKPGLTAAQAFAQHENPPWFSSSSAPKPKSKFNFGGLFGLDTQPAEGPKLPPKGAKLHPALDDHGNPIVINYPTKPSGKETWDDPKAVATFTPGGEAPASLHGVKFESWTPPKSISEWANVAGQNPHADAPFMPAEHKAIGAGVIIQEPDGRVWVTRPTNSFGGYNHTLPKGTVEKGLSLQASAIKEAFEETGLKVEIIGIHGDYERTTSKARYFLARRVGGTPRDMGWESQALRLAPVKSLPKLFNMAVDQKIASSILSPKARTIVEKYNPLQPRWPEGSPLGGQWKKYKGSIVLPPVVAGGLTSKNPEYQQAVNAAFDAAEKGDWKAVEKAKAKLDSKMSKIASKSKANWHDNQTAKVHQYVTALHSDHLAGPAVEAKADGLAGPMKLSDMTKVAAKPGGSASGAIYQDKNGDKWLVKGYGNDVQAASEVIASKIYAAAGVATPVMQTIDLGSQHKGGIGVASKMLDEPIANLKPGSFAAAQAKQDFAAHVLLNNYDAMGLSFDNTMVGQFTGKIYMIDPGGSFDFKATGGNKEFSADVGLWDTLRDPKINPQGAAIFGKMTASDLAESVKGVAQIENSTIKTIVDAHHPGSQAEKNKLTQTLIDRKTAIMAKAGLVGDKSMPKPVAAAAAAAALPSDSKAPRDKFAPPPKEAFKGDKASDWAGLSETIKSLHQKGDITALQGFNNAYSTAAQTLSDSTLAYNSMKMQAYTAVLLDDLTAKQAAASAPKPPPVDASLAPPTADAFHGSKYAKDNWAKKAAEMHALYQAGNQKQLEKTTANIAPGALVENSGKYSAVTLKDYGKKLLNAMANKPASGSTSGPASVPVPDFGGSEHTKSKWAAKVKVFNDAIAAGDMKTVAKIVEHHATAVQTGKIGAGAAMTAMGKANYEKFLSYAAKVMPKDINDAATLPVKIPKFEETAPGVAKAYADYAAKAGQAFKDGDVSHLQKMHAIFSTNPGGGNNSKMLADHIGKMIDKVGGVTNLAASDKAMDKSVASPLPKVAAASSPKPAMPDWDKAMLPPNNSNAPSHNNKIKTIKDLADAGNVNGILSLKYGTNTYAPKQVKVANEALAALGSMHTVSLGQKANSHPALGGENSAIGIAAAAAASVAEHSHEKGKLDVAKLPKPPDFENWNGPGKGLSSHPEYNTANKQEAHHLLGLAQTGHIGNLTDYAVKSPSKHVIQYKDDLIDAIDSMLNPPPPLKLMDHKSGTVDDVGKLFPSKFAIGTKPETIKGNEKVGWYAALGVLKSNIHTQWKDGNKEPPSEWVQAAYHDYQHKLSPKAKAGIKIQQGSGHTMRANLNAGGNAKISKSYPYTGKEITEAWKNEAPEIPAGSKIYRYLSLPEATKNKLLSLEPGTVLTDLTPQCASHKNGLNSGFGYNKFEFVALPGAKGMRSFGSGGFQSEMETTLLAGARFIVHKVRKRKNGGIKVKAFLLPPD